MSNKRIRIEIGETPIIPTSNPGTAEHQEAHKHKEILIDERLIDETRKDIFEHYQIDNEHTILLPAAGEKKREIRAFIIIFNKENNKEKYYADGHTNHATMLDAIFLKFSNIGIANTHSLPDDFDEKWEIKKGFIDPYNNGFREFSAIRRRFEEELIKKNPNDKEDIVEGKTDIPSWFLS
ncbi:hypothetical protein GYA54_03995 [Candidatus Kuenenbacteria bacterium]|nr:hypothetical protein [Candidatus Kuenenbacteria bacterium]